MWQLAIIIILFSFGITHAEESCRFHGRIENRLFFYDLNLRSRVNPGNIGNLANKDNDFRLYCNLDLKKGRIFNSHMRTILRAVSAPEQETQYKYLFHELFWDYSLNNQLLFRVGKQRVAWGSGYAWNPTDTMEPQKDPFHPKDEKEGISAIKSHILFKSFYLTTFGVYNNETKSVEFAGKLGTSLFNFDLSLSLHKVHNRQPSIGLDFVGFFSDLGVYGEAITKKGTDRYYVTNNGQLQRKNDRYFSKYVLGLTYVLFSNIMFTAEYFHNDEGYSKEEMQNFVNYLPQHAQVYTPIGMGKNSLFFLVVYPDLLEIISLKGIMLTNLFNLSSVLLPEIVVSPTDYFSLAVMFQVYTDGTIESEKNLCPIDRCIRLRVMLYFYRTGEEICL